MRDFQMPGRSAVYATNGMCATSHPLAARVAVNMLEAGGNAVDGAIAAAFVLGIAEPQMTGIGGDCFVLLKPAGQDRIIALNGSGRAPAGLDPERLRAAGHEAMPLHSADAVTIPGAVDCFWRLSQDWGRLEFSALLAPAIRHAEEGVPVAPRTAFDWARAADCLQGPARRHYLISGRPPATGQIFRAPALAEALRLIGEKGRDAFYEGEIAADMIESLQAAGGSHAPEDFAATACAYTEPVTGQYKGSELFEHPPNGQGATAILMANILKNFDLPGLDPFGARRAHLEAEAAKLAYDARNRFLADPAHVERLDHMLSQATADALAALIDPARAMPDPHGLSEAVHRDTVYLTVVDRDRCAVSLIFSIYHAFGSGIASEKYGILFQNRGAGFSLIPGHPNEAGGGKRPMHTIIPAFLRRGGQAWMPFGVMGGAYQPAGHVRLMTNLIDYGMDLQAAIDAPRSFPDAGVLQVERGYGEDVHAALREMGHEVVIPEVPLGGAQAIIIDEDEGVLIGASDPRKDGCALGY